MNSQKRKRKAEFRGRIAEVIAAFFCRLKGYRVLERRYRTPVGEIDLILLGRGVIVFTEIKWRRNLNDAIEAVHDRNRGRIIQAAELFLMRNPGYSDNNMRFDVIALAPWRWPVHLKNAFDTSS